VKDLRATVKFKAGKSQVTTQNLRDANTAWWDKQHREYESSQPHIGLLVLKKHLFLFLNALSPPFPTTHFLSIFLYFYFCFCFCFYSFIGFLRYNWQIKIVYVQGTHMMIQYAHILWNN
jgi:hypothetical protein